MTVIARLRKYTRAATTALTGVNTAVAEVRAEIAAMQNRLAKLEDRPADRATIEATLDHGLEGLAGRGSYAFKLLARRLTGWGGEGSHFEIADDDLGPMMVAMLRDQLRAGALAAVAQVMGNDTGISEDDRDAERPPRGRGAGTGTRRGGADQGSRSRRAVYPPSGQHASGRRARARVRAARTVTWNPTRTWAWARGSAGPSSTGRAAALLPWVRRRTPTPLRNPTIDPTSCGCCDPRCASHFTAAGSPFRFRKGACP